MKTQVIHRQPFRILKGFLFWMDVQMISKLSTKLAVLILAILSPLLTSAAQASDGHLVTATPFDNRVFSAGIFFDKKDISEPAARRSSIEELFAIAKSFRYVHVPRSRWQTPEETQARGSGDCADKAGWLYSQLKKNGYENVRLVIGKYRSIDPIFHVWIAYTDDQGNSLILDPATQKRIWGSGQFGEGFYKALYSYDDQGRYRYDF